MKLLDRFRGVCAQRHFSPRTVECYEAWIRQFLGHFRRADGSWRHPRELRGAEVGQFLTHLAQPAVVECRRGPAAIRPARPADSAHEFDNRHH